MKELLDQIAAAGFLDWLALLTSLAYVWLAARDNNWCWLFAAISTAVWAWQSFFEYHLVSDGLLQVFYFVMAGVGIWRWRGMKKSRQKKIDAGTLDELIIPERGLGNIVSMSVREHLLTILGGLIGGLGLGYFFSQTLVAAATYPDAITTVFSVITTFLLIGRRLENWLYWIVIDVVYVWIYAGTGAILFAMMMIINVGMAIYGYQRWRQEAGQPNLL
ncbi:nicotinamide riboside transporter PnuC [Neolewinella persica]|uniref:nicotinamide riboside transporter PnuC n=1 Tax=Neolewinella persica TaxID=70998 RepID=UPI00039E9AE9|nr:nicotinamide riboside transporter PnuC [Neolewinella persica]